jgi:hypothetical protein
MGAMGPLSKLTSRMLSLLIERHHERGLTAAEEVFSVLESMAANVEASWGSSPLSDAQEADIGDSNPPRLLHDAESDLQLQLRIRAN